MLNMTWLIVLQLQGRPEGKPEGKPEGRPEEEQPEGSACVGAMVTK